MWIPDSAGEIERRAADGDLVETHSFDSKLELPKPRRNIDLAIDVAAMTPDGGVLLYGVGEDDDDRLSVLQPLALAGLAERVSQIVATSISEVPYIEVGEYPSDADPSIGYLAVIVPQSPRAPHQVIVGNDLRFYGRGPKGNRRLTEGEVARLYERRQSWAVDREAILAEVVASAPFPRDTAPGHLHAYTRPVAPDNSMLERAMEAVGGRQTFHQRLLDWIHATRLRGQYGPSLEHASQLRRRGADEWRLSNLPDTEHQASRIKDLVDLHVNVDGRGQLFCGRATDTHSQSDHELIIEFVIAGNLEAFVAVMGQIYGAAGYHGQVDVGVAITGLTGSGSALRSNDFYAGPFTYSAEAFTRTARVAARELLTPHEVPHSLLRSFYEATSGRDGFNPFEERAS